jgi:hypothetical protein
MFDAAPSAELPPGFEPAELPGMEESAQVADEPVVAEADPLGLGVDALSVEGRADVDKDRLAQIVTPVFGGERLEPTSEVADTQESAEYADEAEEPTEVAAPAAEHDADTTEPSEDPEPEPVVARADDAATEEPEGAEAPVRLQIRRPLSAAPASSALEGEFVPEHDDSEDSTIFGQLRSNWLSDEEDQEALPWADSEVDRGWNAADRADNGDAEGKTRTGLPVRRPGGRLVPGGVSQEPSKVVRDPEAIRNRLAAHAAGVSRGRAAAAAAEPDTFDYSHEETGPA